MDFRTDLALERRDIYQKANGLEKIPGIETEEKKEGEDIRITRVRITDEEGVKALGKPVRNLYYA